MPVYYYIMVGMYTIFSGSIYNGVFQSFRVSLHRAKKELSDDV